MVIDLGLASIKITINHSSSELEHNFPKVESGFVLVICQVKKKNFLNLDPRHIVTFLDKNYDCLMCFPYSFLPQVYFHGFYGLDFHGFSGSWPA